MYVDDIELQLAVTVSSMSVRNNLYGMLIEKRQTERQAERQAEEIL